MKTRFIFLGLILGGALANATVQTPLNQDKQTRLFVQSYQQKTDIQNKTYFDDYDVYGNALASGTGQNKSHDDYNWTDGQEGSGSQSDQQSGTYQDRSIQTSGSSQWTSQQNWPPSTWENLGSDYGTQTASGDYDWDVFSPIIGPPVIIKEHCNINVPYGNSWTDYNYPDIAVFENGGYSGNYVRTADAVMKLQTGGKAIPGRQNLWAIGASATQYTPINAGAGTGAPEIVFLPQSIVAQDIIIGELGKQGSDGKLWVMLPDDVEKTVTPSVPGKDYYIFDITRTDKYTLTINANDHDLSQETPEFCVGQLVTFVPHWSPGTPPYTEGDSIFHWHLPDKFVNEPYQYSAYCNSYRRNDVWLAYRTTHCWYVNQPGGACSIGMNLKFSNGQAVSIAAAGNFTVYRPTRITDNMCDEFGVTVNITDPCLYVTNIGNTISLGDHQGGYARFWAAYRAKPGDCFQETQIVQSYRQWGYAPPLNSGSDWWFDGAWTKPGSISPAGTNGIGLVQQTDKYPWVYLEQPESKVNDVFKTYFQYNPGGGGIWVTLGRINWSWADDATYNGSYWNIPSGTISSPQYHEDDNFPLWDGNHP